MVLTELLFMTKPKLMLLVILLVGLIPNYYDYGCTNGVCASTTQVVCQCGFQPANFFTIFIISYIVACFIGEIFRLFKKPAKEPAK